MIFTLTDRHFNVLDAYETDDYLIGQYIGSILETLDISILTSSSKIEHWVRGNYIFCRDKKGRGYWFTIYDDDESSNDDVRSLTCYTGTIDVVAEEFPPFSASTSQSFEWYFNKIFADTGIEIGINEISNLTRKLEFTSSNATNAEMLQFVLNGFDSAEAQFEVVFDGVVPKRLILNIYKRIGETEPQALLSDKDDTLIELNRNGSISELGTSLYPIAGEGEDEITLIGEYYEERDDYGEIVYYSPINSARILAPQARENFYVELPDKTKGGYINRTYHSQASSKNALWAEGLTQLKKIDHAIINYKAQGVINCSIGDNVQIECHKMAPPVLLSARVTTYKFNDDDQERNEYEFSNFVDLESNINELSQIISKVKESIVYIEDQSTTYAIDNQGDVPPTGEWYDKWPPLTQGMWLWTKVTIFLTNGTSNNSYSVSYIGEDGLQGPPGEDGDDGIGILNTTFSYSQSLSSSNPPENGWTPEVPSLIKGQYLWTRTIWKYTNNSTETGYTVSYNAKDGNNGTDGIAGKDGVGITNTKIEYAGSLSGTVKPTSGWTNTIPSVPDGQYLWTKTTWTYSDETIESGFSVAKMGEKGEPGRDGINGEDGTDGKDGQDAKEVISGYLSNESLIVPANVNGVVTDFTKALGDFIIYEGQTKVTTGVTYSKISENGMTSTINSSGRYTVTALSTDVGTATYQAIYKGVTLQKILIIVKSKQGANGVNGVDGKGIVSSTTTYQAGSSGTAPPGGTWTESVPTVSENQFLWTKIALTYSDNTTSIAYSVGKMGAKGSTGATGSTGPAGKDGNGIKSTAITFASSTSGTSAPSSGWSPTIPTVTDGNFLWTRTIITFTDNTTNTSYTVAKQGEKGDPTGIISQSTVPSNPYIGMLWQNTGASGYIIGATYQWNGSKFNLYIFTADNIVATTLSAITANLGNITAGTINGVEINGSEFNNAFSYTDGGVTYTGNTTMKDGNVIISRTGSDGSTWTTKVDRQLGFEDSYKAGSTAPTRTTRLGQGKLYMVESGVGGYLPASALNPTSWVNLPYASGWTTAENNPCQYRMFPQLDGSYLIRFRGQFAPTSGTIPSGNQQPFGAGGIPVAIRPDKTEFGYGASNQNAGGRLAISGAGNFFYNPETTGQTYCSISGISYYIG